jgi:6-phosphogluconolactonase (cycloisomerase 2 family)
VRDGSTRGLALGIVLALAVAAGVWIAAFGDFNGDSGGLTQKAGRAGCVSVDGTGGFSEDAKAGECAVAGAVGLPTALVLSPDGRNAYVAAHREAVAALDRDPRSGALAAKRGPTGCSSRDGTAGGERARRLQGASSPLARDRTCATARGLFGVTDVALSPDGRNAYVGSAEGLAVFDRDAPGGLTQKRGAAGCLTRTGVDRTTGRRSCGRARGLEAVSSVTVSPDGRTVYVTTVDLLAFRRDPRTGALTQIAGRAGCVAATPVGEGGADCVADPAVEGATSLALSPDGRYAYAASGGDPPSAGAVAALRRDRSTGALTPVRGQRGCIAEHRRGCAHALQLHGAAAVVTSPDGANAYVVSFLDCSVAVFDRDAASGALRQKLGVASSVEQHGDSGACDNRRTDQGSGAAGGDVTVGPDGRTVFVTARAGVAMYARAPGGALRYAGCVSDDGEGTCEDVRALNAPAAPAVSPDGRNLYVAAFGGDAIAAFDVPRRPGGG